LDTVHRKLLKSAKFVLENYKEHVPIKAYMFVLREYKKACKRVNRVIEKERERNHKFVQKKSQLYNSHQEEILALKSELYEKRREVVRYKTVLKDRGLLKEGESDSEKLVLKEDIHKILKERLSGEDLTDLLDRVVKDVTKSVFNFSRINITFFEENKILILQRAIFKRVQISLESDSSSLISGAVNTILRDNFIYLHRELAKKVLEASDVDRGVFKFFESYFVTDESGNRWSAFAITRFMHEYLVPVRVLERLENDLDRLILKLAEYRAIEDDLEMEFETYSGKVEEKKKIERLIDLSKTKISEEEEKIAELEKRYELLLEGVTKLLLQKKVIYKNEQKS
jgi:hypothetical protein